MGALVCCGDKNHDEKALPFELGKVKMFVPMPKSGLVVKVVDGDTLNIISDCYGDFNRFSVRIRGVDTPELRGKTAEERKAAEKAKMFVEQLCLGKEVTLRDHCREKYGRVCASVWIQNKCIANELIFRRLGYPYHGGPKKKFETIKE